MIIDSSGIELTPGNFGKDCAGNGESGGECCCDECDYFLCCFGNNYPRCCNKCHDGDCPRNRGE